MQRHPLLRTTTILLALGTLPFAHDTEEHKLVASDGAPGDNFGHSVDVLDEDIVAGAPMADALGPNSGAAYVFVHDGTDFVEQAKLLPTGGLDGDRFGNAVAIDADTVVVGAPGTSPAVAGSAYVFLRTGTTWAQQAELISNESIAGDLFGSSVDVLGDTAIVGASGSGTAFVFLRTGTSWAQQKRLSASDGSAGNQFGAAVSLGVELALVGAPNQVGVKSGTGAAYVYGRSGVEWTQDQKLAASDGDAGDRFGASVSIGDFTLLLVGAPGDDDTGLDSGAAYQWARPGLTWLQGVKRLGVSAGDWLGSSVDLSFGYTVTGTSNYDYISKPLTGGVILWLVDQAPLVNYFVASDEAPGDRLGISVAMNICDIVGGCPGDDQLGEDSGAVYVFAAIEGGAVAVNGSGVNPLIMTTEVGPNIGDDWHLEVDATAYLNANQSLLYLYRKFAVTPILRPYGEILVDLGSQRILVRVESGSGLFTHEMTLPDDPALIGLQAAAQVVLRNTSTGSIEALTNGELITIGCHGGHE